MTRITIRNLPDAVEAKLRALAERSGASLNQTVVQVLEAVTGGRPLDQPRTICPQSLRDGTPRTLMPSIEPLH